MIFYENRLLADDSHEISYLIFSKFSKDVAKFVVCCSCDWRLRINTTSVLVRAAKLVLRRRGREFEPINRVITDLS